MTTIKPLALTGAQIPAYRAPLPVTWARYIPGDYPGLRNLAGQLYGFAEQCNGKATTLAGYVNGLVGEDDFTGDPANAFMNSYGVDAAIMNGLDRIVCAMAGVIDTLALRLAGLEAKLEEELQNCYEKGLIVHDGLGPDGPNFKANPTYAASSDKASAQLTSVYMEKLHQHRTVAQIQAETYRTSAAVELAGMAKIVASGLDYYLKKDGFKGYTDPGGLLSGPQLQSDPKAVTRLKKQLTAEEQALADSGVDWKNVAGDLRAQGDNVQAFGNAAQDIKDLRSATGLLDLLNKSQKVADEVGPLIAKIGALIAVEPIK
jgi:hypothetical protein